MSWTPCDDFLEHQDISFDRDFLRFSIMEKEPKVHYERPHVHIEYALEKKRKLLEEREAKQTKKECSGILATNTVRYINNSKLLQDIPCRADGEKIHNVEQEMVNMIRFFGMDSSDKCYIDEEKTIPTYPVTQETITSPAKFQIPVFMNDKLFQLSTSTETQNESKDINEEKQVSKTYTSDTYTIQDNKRIIAANDLFAQGILNKSKEEVKYEIKFPDLYSKKHTNSATESLEKSVISAVRTNVEKKRERMMHNHCKDSSKDNRNLYAQSTAQGVSNKNQLKELKNENKNKNPITQSKKKKKKFVPLIF